MQSSTLILIIIIIIIIVIIFAPLVGKQFIFGRLFHYPSTAIPSYTHKLLETLHLHGGALLWTNLPQELRCRLCWAIQTTD